MASLPLLQSTDSRLGIFPTQAVYYAYEKFQKAIPEGDCRGEWDFFCEE